ncbi:MAG: Peptidase E [Syntrophomonadaceae bacterium]|nr:Peptidase E [Bacillota bacterium]
MTMGILFLTSTGLSCEAVTEKLKLIFADQKNRSVAIITTAAVDKENNKYSQLAKKQFLDMGIEHVDFVDLESEPNKDLSHYEIIYVCGGNTFKLLKFAREANFKSSIENLLKRNGIYIGVSAGSIIVCPSIEIVKEVAADKNEIGLEDLTGFGITNLIVVPHYSPEVEEKIKTFEAKYGVVVERLNNSQAVLIENGGKTIIE